MPESTRVGYAGNVEVHLKKRLEITSEIVSQVATLPSSEPWYVLGRDPDTGDWTFEQSFDSFEAADDQFVTMCGNNGLGKAERLAVGRPAGDGQAREVRP